MVTDRTTDDATIRAAVQAAIAAAGNAGPGGVAWRSTVMRLIPECAAMLELGSRESQLAKQVLEAAIFSSVYHSHTIEESSTRAIVTLVKNDAGETETIRTMRTDNSLGKAMLSKLGALQQGQQVVIWKAIEEMANRADRKVRVLVHLEARRMSAPPTPTGPPPAEERQAEAPPAPVRPQEPVAPAEGDVREAIRQNIRLAKDQDKTLEAIRKRYGITYAKDIPEDKLEEALYMSLHEGETPF